MIGTNHNQIMPIKTIKQNHFRFSKKLLIVVFFFFDFFLLSVAIERIPVSVAIKDLIGYCEEHQKNDPFVVGFNPKANPFYSKSSCVLI